MKSFLILNLLFFACTINVYKLSAQKIVSTKDSAKEKTYAVIVGITDYKNPAIPALQFADKDAEQFSAYLQSKGGGLVPEKHIKLLTNKKATIAAIYDALDWLKTQCHENDVAYIYFSGHGDVETTKKNYSKGYLLAYNSPQTNYANNAISVEDINNTSVVLTTKNKANVILISDACHSGKLAGDFYKGKQFTARQLNLVLNNQVRLASCRENEEAAEGPDWGGGRGVFSYYLVMGLQGLADIRKDNIIQLRDLTKYLDSSFAVDRYLIQNKHFQNPVTDGNPNYPIAITDSGTLHSLMANIKKNKSGGSGLPPGFMKLEPLKPQPIDVFFTSISSMPIESILDFDSYNKLEDSAIPLAMVNDCIVYQDKLLDEKARTSEDDFAKKNYALFSSDSLILLKNELLNNQSINNQFIEKFIQSVHDKGQDMISAYIKGDMDELERRQYYYSGKRDYKKYLSMLHIALKVVPENHALSRILTIHNYYITGLTDRLQMATNSNKDSLLKLAFYNQQQALKMEPYAAYILNELGNLYLQKNNYDSAKYNFDLASQVSPTWAIPWSNKIRLNMVFNKFNEAEKDFHTADSLQSNLAFVFTNAGMMMEKKKDLLAAESYYLRAIKINNVHFLPFERLGYLYLNTAEYQKSNYYLYQAQTRKQDFSIVPKSFDIGIAMSVLPDRDVQDFNQGCPQRLVAKNETARQYIKLLNGLQKPDSSNARLKLLQEVVTMIPNIPLANHYLGKEYYLLGKWQTAKKALLQSLSIYVSTDELKKKLAKDIFGRPLASQDECQIQALLHYQYDVLEDHYLLAALYEKSGENAKAFDQYQSISSIENARLSDQATYSTFIKRSKGLTGEMSEKLMKNTEKFILMGGAIKAARLHEKLGQYDKAEKLLLRQVSLSRAAGNARMEAYRKINWNVDDENRNYWLSINSYLESEVYNFYKKVLNLFPRDPVWQEKAGLFLYNRLASAFSEVPIDLHRKFYLSIRNFAYPWKPDMAQNENYYFVIPGTDESLAITATTFDPVEEALDALNISVKLSGDIRPHINAAKGLADLNSWLGNEDQAIYWYKEAILLDAGDAPERNKFMYYLKQVDRLPDAYRQLDTLYRQKKIKRDQVMQLADWKWLSGETKDAKAITANFKPVNKDEQRFVLDLNAKIKMLSGDTKNALQLLLDTVLVNRDSQVQNFNRLYSIARLYALLKNDGSAYTWLKMALDSGFNNEYVIYYDNAWAEMRGSKKWNNVVKNSPYPLIEPQNYKIYPFQYSSPKHLH